MDESPLIDASDSPPKEDALSFKPSERIFLLSDIQAEFERMRSALKTPLTPKIAATIVAKSGSHLLKLVSPRVDGDHAVLRINPPQTNRKATLLPSVNAPDIPFCKVIYRPLRIEGFAAMSVVDHILNPEDVSASVLADFAQVFGAEVLEALQSGLSGAAPMPLKLGAGEFPIVFIPRPGGGDLQITPVSPAASFMGIKRVADRYFQKAQPDAPPPPRGRWTKQAVSSKPQNISGAIGGPRLRFLAAMPRQMHQVEAEMHRFVQGGSFPRWRDDEIAKVVLRYDDMLTADETYNNSDTRAALERIADRLIADAQEFISEVLSDAAALAHSIGHEGALPKPPQIVEVLIRRRWPKEGERDRAVKALTSPHFEDRLRKFRGAEELEQ